MKLTREVHDAIERARAEGRVTETGHVDKGVQNAHTLDASPSGASPNRSRRPPKLRPMVDASIKVTITLPITVKSELNQRGHWSKRAKRFRSQKDVLQTTLINFGMYHCCQVGKVSVTFTKLGGRAMDDDNLRGSFKGLRDEVASWMLDVNDADPRITWKYEQEPKGRQGVRIEIEA